MRSGENLLRLLTVLNLYLSLAVAAGLTILTGVRGFAGMTLLMVSFVAIFMTASKLFDKYFQVPRKKRPVTRGLNQYARLHLTDAGNAN